MTRKRFNPLEDPPAASSSDEEDDLETSMGEGEEDIARNSSSEEEDDVSSKNPSALKNTVLLLAAPTEKLVSDPESGSDEETDTDSEPEKKDQVVTKRSRETDEAAVSTDVKRAKKTSFQRLWTEDDEIAVLQGLVDYTKDTGVSPYDDTNKVYQLVKKSISFDVSKIQFMEKLRTLKKRYENNLGKAKDGDQPTFVKPHDRKAFELSKLVWGGIRMVLQSGMKSNGKSKKSSKSKKVESVKHEFDCEDDVTNKGEASLVGALEMDTLVKSSLARSIARFGLDELVAQQGLSLLSSEDKKRFEEQWKALQVREFEFLSQKSGFLHKVVTKMTEVSRSNA
ncbi:unnamed protein product [Arabidopsis arenosa]|uniref:Uncharacterized protein n=1 Tax=Arabidopsis arenosa TaxID=38785 RepID=A0A8S1ZCU6_ARAAE|nr:unnamed protein product [Arabidopsis arenosa]